MTEGEGLVEGGVVVWDMGWNVCAGILLLNVKSLSLSFSHRQKIYVQGDPEVLLIATSSNRFLTGVSGPRAPNEASESNDTSFSSVGEGEPERFNAGNESSESLILGERGAIPWLNGESRLASSVAALVSAVDFGGLQRDETRSLDVP